MKTIFTILITVILTSTSFAQLGTASQKMSYQAVVRNSANALVQNSPVGIKISLLEGSITGPAVYVETHSAQTNENGLLNLQIGGGSVVSGTYTNGIYWGQPYFLKTEIDPLGGVNYSITSTSELLSVPVSNFAYVSGSLHGSSWDFVGSYKDEDDIYYHISYMGFNRVMMIKSLLAENFNETYYGTVLGNVITVPLQEFGTGPGSASKYTFTITKNGDILTIERVESGQNPNTVTFTAVKQ